MPLKENLLIKIWKSLQKFWSGFFAFSVFTSYFVISIQRFLFAHKNQPAPGMERKLPLPLDRRRAAGGLYFMNEF
jgi:hypothetical protein